MTREKLILSIWLLLPVFIYMKNIQAVTIGKLIAWLISDILVMMLLILPQLLKPKSKLAKWLMKKIA